MPRKLTTNKELVENYELAKADNFKGWALHHRLETHKYKDRSRTEWVEREELITRSMLIAFGVYYNRPPEELIWLKDTEHKKIHANNMPKEVRENMSRGLKGIKRSDETRRRISEACMGNKKAIGRHWYNNGTISVMRYECPEGFKPGRIR